MTVFTLRAKTPDRTAITAPYATEKSTTYTIRADISEKSAACIAISKYVIAKAKNARFNSIPFTSCFPSPKKNFFIASLFNFITS